MDQTSSCFVGSWTMLDDDDAGHRTHSPTTDDSQSESAARLTRALKSLCPTRNERELAVYILLSELLSGPLDREIPIADPQDNVFGYLVPPGKRSSTRLSPEHVAELYRLAQCRELSVK
jgi:hypothetical protein